MTSTLDAIITQALRMAGDTTPLHGCEPVGGGMISRAARVITAHGEYLLKWGGRGLPEFFTVEARGLALLASTGALRLPAALAWHDPAPTNDDEAGEMVVGRRSSIVNEGFILLEWLAAPPHTDERAAFEALGRGLAALHRATAPAYGLDYDNYIGTTPQPNGWMASWIPFFRERRLRFQANLARRNRRLSGERARRLERLLDRLDTWLDEGAARPSLLHGDLWGGNVLIGPGGAPALVDPAVYYGDREAELAYTALFGGFPDAFYRAYQEVWPLATGWRDRRDLYNLYHLLNQ